MQIIVSAKGKVVSVKVLTGHPMLIQTAIDAVRTWKYEPFRDTHGAETEITTEVAVRFPPLPPETDKESAARRKFFPLDDECRALVNAEKYADAEAKCRAAVAVSNDLPENAAIERSMARAYLAHSLYLQGRVTEAIPLYRESLQITQAHARPDDADLASDYENLARALVEDGQYIEADALYATSISTFEAAIHALPSRRDNYQRRLKRALTEYAALKEKLDDPGAAEQLRQRAAAVP